jgi:hypothetical protein
MIDAWRQRSLEERKSRPLLYAILGDGTPLFKFDPEDIAYTEATEGLREGFGKDGPDTTGYKLGQACGNCRSLFIHKTSGVRICDQMKVTVREKAWCNRWEVPWPVEVFKRYQEIGREALTPPKR